MENTPVKETVLITGGSGFIGTNLTTLLIENGYNVCHLSRHATGREKVLTFSWDPLKGYIEEGAVESADYIVHLAGADIGEKRWTTERKKLIIDSRVKTAELLYHKVQARPQALKAFISASGVGYYGATTQEHIFNEEDSPANDFTGITCKLWEEAADKFQVLGKRVVKLRTAIVLGHGGALGKMAMPVKLWAGAGLGSGRQWFPWIHIDDLVRIYLSAIRDEKMHGAYNAVAPEYATNKEFMATIAKALGKPFFLPNVPAVALKLALGELANAILKGSRISPQKVLNTGFKFKFPHLEPALREALG
jgi:uncharacterized protein